MATAASAWARAAMRTGYLARALFYGLVGLLAMHAAVTGTYAEGAWGALTAVVDETLGRILLWAIAFGAQCFARWCLLAAVLDLDGRGRGFSGLFARADFTVTGAIYAIVGAYVIGLAFEGRPTDDGGNSREKGAAWLLSLPGGSWMLVGLGVGFAVVGGWFVYKALAGRYRDRLKDSRLVRRLDYVSRFGWIAYGLVLVALGAFLIEAGWSYDPGKAGGFAEIFAEVREPPVGGIGLFAVGFGFLSFALESVVEAVSRVVPGRKQT